MGLGLTLQGCKVGCLGGEDGCRVEEPCQKVAFECADTNRGALRVAKIESSADRPRGTNALAAHDDYVLENAFTRVVIAGLKNQNYLDPNGGSLLDLSTRTGPDGVNQALTVTGVLPGDASHYTSIETFQGDDFVAVQVRGTLDGHPDMPIATRYELRTCDTGVRIRTELLNGSPDTQFWGLGDGYYWSKREPIPFTPGEGQGFKHPSFGLTTINGAYQTFPFLAFGFHNASEAASYASISCDGEALHGFNSDTVSIGGMARTVVPPRGWLAFERFIAVADAFDVEGAARIAATVRTQITGEKFVKISGRLERGAGAMFGTEQAGNVLVEEGQIADEPSKRTPWTQVVPAADGRFTATVPEGRSYVISAHAFGRKVAEVARADVSADVDVGTLMLPVVSTVRFEVTEAGTGAQLDAEIFLTAADDATREANVGTFHGEYGRCTPWLGAPPGASPACNRVLVRSGVATADVPSGRFHVYAFHGPFWSLGHDVVTFMPGAPVTLPFQLTRLPLQPAGTVSADLHVHGAASFDSSIPDYDRVLSFSASDLDVIIATDHEVVWDYGQIVSQLGLSSRMTAVTGVETTGHVPWMRIPGYGFPLVVGHYIFWPLPFDVTKPRNGAPFDEFVEPGTLFTRADDLMTTTRNGVFQLNHPWAVPEFGRDLGFPRAVFMDLTKDLPAEDDGTDGRGIYVRTPKDARFANDAHHAQEVMNGSQNDLLLQYRHFWFYTLNQGRLRTGTANSDSHSLTDNTVGMPRNLVYANTTGGPLFDQESFNTAIKNGRVLGTSAPIIEATIDGMDGAAKTYGFAAFRPAATGKLKLRVTTAPWAPVPEVRVIVNGQAVKTLPGAPAPAPFGTTVHVAYDGEVALSELLAGITGDAWIVVEAGRPLPVAEDLGGGLDNAKDGMPDTTDNDGDGKIDQADIAEGEDYGPLKNVPFPAETDPLFHFANVTDNGFPFAFTNPFVLDRDGNGKFDAPGVKGGR